MRTIKSSGKDQGIRKDVLLRTNLLVCIVIILGFIVTTLVGYQANQKIFRKDTESVTALTSKGIFHEIDTIFTKPINISLTMGNDSLLKGFLESEPEHPDDKAFQDIMREYLDTYRKKYNYDSVFLASYATKRYYNFNGLDRLLEEGDPENVWFYSFFEHSEEYGIVIDNDQVKGALNKVTVFINCRIRNDSGETIGVVGVGFQVDSMQQLLKSYGDSYGVRAYLVDQEGKVEISADQTRYEGDINLFDQCSFPELEDALLTVSDQEQSCWHSSPGGSGYVISRYIPNLNWFLIVDHDTTELDQQLSGRLRQDVAVLAAVISLVLLTITSVIRRYNAKIIELTVSVEQEHRTVFQEAAEQLYENIFEIDITHNRAANEDTIRYFQSLGAPSDIPYDKALQIIAEKQVKEEYRQEYLDTFSTAHVMEAYENGEESLRYDFMISADGETYYWMRITTHLFFWEDDKSLRMLVYRENIDAQMKRELYLFDQMQKDSLTGLLNKAAAQEGIRDILSKCPSGQYAFFILDIDNFKGVNDKLGHAAGDTVLLWFAKTLKAQFREGDIVGRIGGDEFAAFVPVSEMETAFNKARRLVQVLNNEVTTDRGTWMISTSIGIALYPMGGTEFEFLYKNADSALYEAKHKGKNCAVMYGMENCGK